MKKRMLAGMMAFIMAGMLTACGSSSSVSESAKSGEDKENRRIQAVRRMEIAAVLQLY